MILEDVLKVISGDIEVSADNRYVYIGDVKDIKDNKYVSSDIYARDVESIKIDASYDDDPTIAIRLLPI